MQKKILKFLMWLCLGIISLIAIIFIAFQVSPRPGAYLISRMFDGPVKITDQESYGIAADQVEVIADEVYPSEFKSNNYDIYYPKNVTEPVPVVIWLHGGGFVGGDKIGVEEFGTNLAADAKVAVVAMNYQVAPSSHYPNQVIQVDELVKALQNENKAQLDLTKLFFGGDSAGSQIALQYVTIQSNFAYAEEVGIKQTVDRGTIKGAISYCGPVDLKQIKEQQSNNKTMKFFVETVAWSLLGKKDWKNDPRLFQASLVDNVNQDFPPLYITDGNAFSFQDQGLALASKLQELGVPVESKFFKDVKKEITHEYQFNYALEESKETYAQTLAFIKEHQ